MPDLLFRIVELIFTSYAVPALLVPLVWSGGWVLGRPMVVGTAQREALGRLLTWYFIACIAWLAVWLTLRLGVPLDRLGSPVTVVCWAGYAGINLLLARLLVRFTQEYGSLPPGGPADRLFAQLLGAIVLQPATTALAFAVIYRISGVIWSLHVPGLPAVQEGI